MKLLTDKIRATDIVRSRFKGGGSNFVKRRPPATAQALGHRPSTTSLTPSPRMAFPNNLWGIAFKEQAFTASLTNTEFKNQARVYKYEESVVKENR